MLRNIMNLKYNAIIIDGKYTKVSNSVLKLESNCFLLNNYQITFPGKGDVFGDAFWECESLGHSGFHVRALTYCDLNSIKWNSLIQVLNFYESFAKSFRKLMLLTFNLRKPVSEIWMLDKNFSWYL